MMAFGNTFIGNSKETVPITSIWGKYVFRIGETFDSYEQLLRRMELHTKESLVYYWRRDSRTVERAFTKTSRSISKRLKYYIVRFACIFGGMKFHTKGGGRRTSQSIRTDCPAFILLRASKCGEKLEVISVCNDHNHEISEKASQLLPQNRRLPKELKDEVLEMLKLKIDRKKIIEYVDQRIDKKIKSKDLVNLAAKLKTGASSNDNPLKKTIIENIRNYTTDDSIRSIINMELVSSNIEDEIVTINAATDECENVEYITPDHEFIVHETMIETVMNGCGEDISEDYDENKESSEFIDVCSISGSKVKEENELKDNDEITNSPIINYEEIIDQDEEDMNNSNPIKLDVFQVNGYTDADEDSDRMDVANTDGVILFETTAVADSLQSVDTPKKRNLLLSLSEDSQNKKVICKRCCTENKNLKMQIKYLQLQNNQIEQENNRLLLENKKLTTQIHQLKKY